MSLPTCEICLGRRTQRDNLLGPLCSKCRNNLRVLLEISIKEATREELIEIQAVLARAERVRGMGIAEGAS